MNDMDSIREYLKNGIRFSPNPETGTHGAVLRIYSDWRPGNPGVESIIVRLAGIDPLTGRDVWNEKLQKELTDRNCEGSLTLPYHGAFRLRFTAVTASGRTIEDFREPMNVQLEYKHRAPRVEIRQSTEGKYRRVDIRSNCWSLLRGGTWLCVNGHYQLLPIPEKAVDTLSWYVPSQSPVELRFANEIEKYNIIPEYKK